MVSVGMVIYLLYAWPHNTRFAVKIEVMNECSLIILTYGLMCFTDFVPEPETRSLVGECYIVVTISNYAIHIFFLLRFNIGHLWWKCRRRFYRRRAIKLRKQKVAAS